MWALGKLLSDLSYVLLPPICGVCGERLEPDDEAVCGACRNQFQEMGRSVCPFCGSATRSPSARPSAPRRCEHCPRPVAHFQSARAAYRYDTRMAEAVQAFKYNQRYELGRALARAMFMAFVRLAEGDGEGEERDRHQSLSLLPVSDFQPDPTALRRRLDFIVPVPMHFTRRWKRGYNHAEVLAQEFATLAHLSCRPELLTRVRRTPRQALLPPDQRATNVLGAFAAEHPDTVAGRRIGLFDDVLTSGSTVNECARTLKLAGAAEVHVLALSRA